MPKQIADEEIKELDWVYDAFYGPNVPMSFKRTVAVDLTNVLSSIYNDLKEAYPDIEVELVKKATDKMLETMRLLGAKSPNIYYSKSIDGVEIIIKSFQYAIRVVQGKPCPKIQPVEGVGIDELSRSDKIRAEAQALREQREIEDKELETKLEERACIANKLYKSYRSLKRAFMQNGEDEMEAKLHAYEVLLNNEWDGQSDYGYFLMTYRIPSDEMFDQHESFLRMMCDDPRVHDQHEARGDFRKALRI